MTASPSTAVVQLEDIPVEFNISLPAPCLSSASCSEMYRALHISAHSQRVHFSLEVGKWSLRTYFFHNVFTSASIFSSNLSSLEFQRWTQDSIAK